MMLSLFCEELFHLGILSYYSVVLFNSVLPLTPLRNRSLFLPWKSPYFPRSSSLKLEKFYIVRKVLRVDFCFDVRFRKYIVFIEKVLTIISVVRTAEEFSKIMAFFYYGAEKPNDMDNIEDGQESIPLVWLTQIACNTVSCNWTLASCLRNHYYCRLHLLMYM